MNVLCVGEMVIDFLPGSAPGVYVRKAGGAPANVAIALSRQGVKATFCGMMGNDDFGRFLRETLRENGVTHCVEELTDEAVTTMAFVSLDEVGERSFTFARKPGADMLLKPHHVRGCDLDSASAVHAGSCSLSKGTAAEATVYALREGHLRGKLVSFDINYRNLMWDDDISRAADAVHNILPYVDLLKISDEETKMLGGRENLPRLMAQHGIKAIVETLGADGARCYFDGRVIEQPGLKARCVDTCGAGDAFWGSFLAAILGGGVTKAEHLTEALIAEALKRGNIGGWLCVQKEGAIESLPTTEAIDRYRKELYEA